MDDDEENANDDGKILSIFYVHSRKVRNASIISVDDAEGVLLGDDEDDEDEDDDNFDLDGSGSESDFQMFDDNDEEEDDDDSDDNEESSSSSSAEEVDDQEPNDAIVENGVNDGDDDSWEDIEVLSDD